MIYNQIRKIDWWKGNNTKQDVCKPGTAVAKMEKEGAAFDSLPGCCAAP
jgi:hypothetical protein